MGCRQSEGTAAFWARAGRRGAGACCTKAFTQTRAGQCAGGRLDVDLAVIIHTAFRPAAGGRVNVTVDGIEWNRRVPGGGPLHSFIH